MERNTRVDRQPEQDGRPTASQNGDTDECKELLSALRAVLGRDGCCCEFGIGNPMVRDHLPACKQAREALNKWNIT